MPNRPDINKKFVNCLMPLELVVKIRSEAKARRMTTTEFIVWILDRELSSVELTSKQYKWIASEVKKNEDKRRGSGNGKSK